MTYDEIVITPITAWHDLAAFLVVYAVCVAPAPCMSTFSDFVTDTEITYRRSLRSSAYKSLS